jgi:hypothetical protein
MVDPDYPAITIDSIQLVSVDRQPAARLSVSCNSQTGASCTYSDPAMLGCGLDRRDTHRSGNLRHDHQRLGYGSTSSVRKCLSHSGIYHHDFRQFRYRGGVFDVGDAGFSNVRNCSESVLDTNHHRVPTCRKAGEVHPCFNLVGEEVWNRAPRPRQGMNKTVFDGDLESGVYLYKVEAGGHTFTGRMALQR